jgi:hypothetical protein
MKRIALILAVLVSLALPAAASAHKHLPNPLTLAEQRASAYWGETPCEGSVNVRFGEPTQSDQEAWEKLSGRPLSPETAQAWSSWESPAGPDSKTPEPATYTNCVITFNSVVWEPSAGPGQMEWAFEELCTTMTHEYGNLLGLREIANPADRSVMSTSAARTPKTCRTPYVLELMYNHKRETIEVVGETG